MNLKIKLSAYAVMLALAAWFAWGFYANYSATVKRAAETATNETAPVGTNAVGENTNASTSSTNAVAADTNQPAAAPVATNTPPEAPAPSPAHAAQGTMIAYLAAFVGAVIGLGLLIAHDVTQYLGNAAVDALLDDGGEGMRDPEYEKAEQVWANGKHLEAIELMRDFLKRHPREQYAALRIAEIYEKDLGNSVAAALEYEEVLKKKLPPERWGWAAVHLCNLYAKLGQQEKTRALLQRIVDEYPNTAAAKKARNRLGLPEPAFDKYTEDNANAAPAAPAPDASAGEKPEDAPPSNLPPGFRPKG